MHKNVPQLTDHRKLPAKICDNCNNLVSMRLHREADRCDLDRSGMHILHGFTSHDESW